MRKHALPALMLGLASLAAVPAFAQQAPVKDPAKVQAGEYTLEKNHTQVLFGVSHFGFTTFYGRFTDYTGTLDFEPRDVSKSKLSVTIQTASVQTANEKLDGELKDANWFDAQKFPTITFETTKVEKTGADKGRITGNLTLHGVTRPVTLAVSFNGGGVNPIDNKYTVGFQATGTLKRTEFGVKTYAPAVGDDVQLIISGAFEHN